VEYVNVAKATARSQLAFTGAPAELVDDLLSSNPELVPAVRELVGRDKNWEQCLQMADSSKVLKVRHLGDDDQIPAEFEPLHCLENGQEAECDCLPRLVVKRGNRNKSVEDVKVGDCPDGFSGVGNVSHFELSVKRTKAPDMKQPPVLDMVWLKVASPKQTIVPPGYKVATNNDGKAYNFAPDGKEFCVFLAYRAQHLMFGHPVTLLSQIADKPDAKFGMVDKFTQDTTGQTEMDFDTLSKKLKESIEEYQSLSKIELSLNGNEVVAKDLEIGRKNLFLKLVQKKSEVLSTLIRDG
jgi:hypothetical protein